MKSKHTLTLALLLIWVLLSKVYFQQPIFGEPASQSQNNQLVNIIEKTKNWVYKTCPQGDYLNCMENRNLGHRAPWDKDTIIHMSSVADAGLTRKETINPFSSNFGEDTCVIVSDWSKNTFQIALVAFDDEAQCNTLANYPWPGKVSINNVCHNKIPGWGHYFTITFRSHHNGNVHCPCS